MKNKEFILFLFLSFFVSKDSLASFSGVVQVKGLLLGYDQQTVSIKTEKGSLHLPRKSTGSLDGMITGRAEIICELSQDELLKALKKSKLIPVK